MTTVLMTPPDDPSRDMANASAKISKNKPQNHTQMSDDNSTRADGTLGKREQQKKRTVSDEVDAVITIHALTEVSIAVTINVGRSRTSNREGLSHQRPTERNIVHLATVYGVPSSNNQTRKKVILVGVAHLLGKGSSSLDEWDGIKLDGVHVKVVLEVVRDGLCVGG
jgi:hypothetical protein